MKLKGAQKNVQRCTVFCAKGGKGRGQISEDGGQKSDVREQREKDKGKRKRSDVGDQGSEDRCQWSEDGGQKPEVRCQKVNFRRLIPPARKW